MNPLNPLNHRAGSNDRTPRTFGRRSAVLALLAVPVAAAIAACTPAGGGQPAPTNSSAASAAAGATDTFPVTIKHRLGETTIPAEPKRVVVVGLTEQDILLELGVVPVATTEWYGDQPHAVWPWATPLLGGARPEVLSDSDGLQLERIAGLAPDLIIGTNSGMDEKGYAELSKIAPTVTNLPGGLPYFSSWQDQTRQVAAAVGRSAAGERLITEVEQAYAKAAAAHPAFAGKTATFSQATPSDGVLWVYQDGLNTDFLTNLGFTITPGLEKYSKAKGEQAQISAEKVGLLEANVVVFASEEAKNVADVLAFGTMANLPAVKEHRTVFTDGTLAGAIYFLTPLSQKYVIQHLVPRLVKALEGKSPHSIEG